jgi:hypothetical protein
VVTPSGGSAAGTDPDVDYETYGWQYLAWNGTTYSANSLATYNLSQPYHASGAGVTAAGLPLMGTDDWGEDALLPSIDHIAYMVVPGGDAKPVATGGYVPPASKGNACVSSCAYSLPFGARLRLNANLYTCPSQNTNPQAYKICEQLETFGAIVMDHGAPTGTVQIVIGQTNTGANNWNSSDLCAISATCGHGIPLSDFDVMTLGPIAP